MLVHCFDEVFTAKNLLLNSNTQVPGRPNSNTNIRAQITNDYHYSAYPCWYVRVLLQ